jgi:lipid II:glycine glycyltransferase (peptidoglycan interpeptide bridge formation enzyme)
MTELTLAKWNEFLAHHPEAHILQSGEWGELKTAFGWEAIRVVEQDIGAQLLFRRLPLGLTFGYIPKGPIGSSPSPEAVKRFWSLVDATCRRKRAIFLKVEEDCWADGSDPQTALCGGDFHASPQHVQPRSTLVIDLHGSEEDVFNRMKPKTRYNIRLAGRKEIIVHPSQDLVSFHAVMEVTSRREAFHVHSLEYYRRAYELFHSRGMCELLVSELQGRILAAVMVFASGKHAYYFYGASADEERNRKPTYPVQWEAIRWSRGRGCEEYDMWGIPDEVQDDPSGDEEEREDGLWGVYRFKRGFGGNLRRAVPTMDRIYNPWLYRFYRWRLSPGGSD